MRSSSSIVTGISLIALSSMPGLILSASAEDGLQPVTIESLAKLKRVSSPAISPDGEWVAYVVRARVDGKDETRSRIFMSSADGETTLPMTGESYSASNPQWSPDGKQLAFTAARTDLDEDAKAQVWTLDMRGGEAVAFTDVKQGVSVFEWAPDSTRMLLMIQDESEHAKLKAAAAEAGEDEPELPWVIDRLQFKEDGTGYLDRSRVHIYVARERLAEPVQMTFGDRDDSDAVWSPNGNRIAYSTNATDEPDSNENSDIFVISSAPGNRAAPIQLTTNPGPDWAPAWSPDGETIAYTTSVKPELLWYATQHLATVSASGGSTNILTESLDRNVWSPAFSKNGRSVYFMVEDGGRQPVLEATLRNGKITSYIGGDSSIYDFEVSKSGDVAYLMSTPAHPSEVFVKSGRRTAQVSQVNTEALAGMALSAPQFVSFDSTEGASVQTFIYPPVSSDAETPPPAILFPHGGPVAQYDYSFEPFAQLFASNGYTTIMPNPRGSTGRGEDYKSAIFAAWGVRDLQDVLASVDKAIEMGLADPDRLGVGGWSYGGMMTNYVITGSDRFKAAVSGASEVNYTANYGHDIYQLQWEIEMGLPWENQAGWDAISPFWKLDQVVTPTLVIVGEHDWNVPAMNSEQLYVALKRLGLDTELVVYPGEDHSIGRPSFIDDRYERWLGWFDKYLKPE